MDDNEPYNGSFGLMYYNRRKQHKNTTRDRDQQEWILAIGEHDGFVAVEIFVRVQYKLNKNKNTAPRNSKDKSKGYYNYFRCITREQKLKF